MSDVLVPPDLPDLEARLQRLRGPLVAELPRARIARRGAARALGLAAAAVVIATVAIVVSRGPAPALAVERQDGWLVLRIADASVGAAALTEQLQDAGVRGEVRLLPVAEDEIGTWAVVTEWAEPPPPPGSKPNAQRGADGKESVVRLDRVRNEGKTLRIPLAEVRESTGYFVFYVGRRALPGEQRYRDGDMNYRPACAYQPPGSSVDPAKAPPPCPAK
jgi:hypothetical protein